MPCVIEEWFGYTRLQPVVHGFLLFWDHLTLVISPLATTMARWWQWQKQRSSCSLAVNLAFYCKVLVQQHIKLPHVWNSRFDLIKRRSFQQKFRGNNFRGWGKIHKNSKIYCPQKFPTIRYMQRTLLRILNTEELTIKALHAINKSEIFQAWTGCSTGFLSGRQGSIYPPWL